MLPNNTSGPASGRQLGPTKRRDPPHPSSIPAKRVQVVAACQNCRLKKGKVCRLIRSHGGHKYLVLTQVITVRCTPSLHSLCESRPCLSICHRAWRNHKPGHEAKARRGESAAGDLRAALQYDPNTGRAQHYRDHPPDSIRAYRGIDRPACEHWR